MEKFVIAKLSLTQSEIAKRRLPFKPLNITNPDSVSFLCDISDLLPLTASPPDPGCAPSSAERIQNLLSLFADQHAVLLITKPPDVVKQIWKEIPSVIKVRTRSMFVNEFFNVKHIDSPINDGYSTVSRTWPFCSSG